MDRLRELFTSCGLEKYLSTFEGMWCMKSLTLCEKLVYGSWFPIGSRVAHSVNHAFFCNSNNKFLVLGISSNN